MLEKLIGSTVMIAAVVLVTASWTGCDSGPDIIVEPDPDTTGTISGVVREAYVQTPLSGITVAFESTQTTTDDEGRFVFSEVPRGLGTLRISVTDYYAYARNIFVQTGENSFDISLMRAFDLQFDHANNLVGDLEESVAYYKHVLGLSELQSPWGANSSVRVFSFGGSRQLYAVQDAESVFKPHARNHFSISVQDFDGFLDSMEAKGVPYGTFSNGSNGSFQVRLDGVRQIYFQDPYGNWIEVNDAQSGTQISSTIYDHSGVFVNSLTVSTEFYWQIMRLKEIDSPWNDTTITRFLSLGNTAEIHFIPASGEAPIKQEKGMHLTYKVRFFDAFLTHLTSQDVVYENFAGEVGQADTRPDGVEQVYFQDPFGNWIEIIAAQ